MSRCPAATTQRASTCKSSLRSSEDYRLTSFQPTLPSPRTLIGYGPHATGKSSAVKLYLETHSLLHAIVKCEECITGRHLLERIVTAVHEAIHSEASLDTKPTHPGRCESLNTLSNSLQTLLQRAPKFVLVLDAIDRQRDPPPTLLPALIALGDTLPNLTLCLITRHPPSPRALCSTGIQHLLFPAYTRTQSLHILSQKPLPIFSTSQLAEKEADYDEATHLEDQTWLYPRFLAAVWDSLAQNCARDLLSFRRVAHRLWPAFIAPIQAGEYGTRDFSRLVVAQRRLFQDESVLLDSIVSATTTNATPAEPAATTRRKDPHDLPYYTKYLLLAAYLASFNPPKTDALFFMKATEHKKKRRKRNTNTTSSTLSSRKNRKVPRHLLAPSAFPLDRLLAILHAILPHDVRTGVDVYAQIAMLVGLRLLVRSAGADVLAGEGKYRVGAMVGWEYVQGLARGLDFGLADYVAE